MVAFESVVQTCGKIDFTYFEQDLKITGEINGIASNDWDKIREKSIPEIKKQIRESGLRHEPLDNRFRRWFGDDQFVYENFSLEGPFSIRHWLQTHQGTWKIKVEALQKKEPQSD